MTVPTKPTTPAELLEKVLIQGDLAKLSPAERTTYYLRVCESLGLNPLTRPFEYTMLNGKLVLYARKDCAEQLRKLNSISVKLLSQEVVDDVLSVHAQATDIAGRTDEDLGAVAFPASLKGEARANAIMKAVTKAKRRVTLSISGLGFLDESEIDDIPGAQLHLPSAPAPNVLQAPSGPLPPQPPLGGGPGSPSSIDGDRPAPSPLASPAASGAGSIPLADMAHEAALRGEVAFRRFYHDLTPEEQESLAPMRQELRALMDEAKQ